jgi:hypothetical protein
MVQMQIGILSDRMWVELHDIDWSEGGVGEGVEALGVWVK